MLDNILDYKLSILALLIFIIAYIFVITEELHKINKYKPMLLASSIIWSLVAFIARQHNQSAEVLQEVKNTLQDYVELFLFLLVAMTYVDIMKERKIFDSLRIWLINHQFNYRNIFWMTGFLSFILSPIIDNLTTSLIMCAVIIAVSYEHKFIALCCINIVVAANAGGVYSPFGDITSLMIWQNGQLNFFEFYKIFLPALISYLIPATIMSLCVSKKKPHIVHEYIKMQNGAVIVTILFILTLITTIAFRAILSLPPVLGMMTGLSYLSFYNYFNTKYKIDIIYHMKNAEWDTLLFFYGIILSVSGLSSLGYLNYISNYLYLDLDFGLTSSYKATSANIILGLISAVIDNIPVVYSVLTMQPEMSKGQWLLITFTTGIGGSLLSVGSASGVALMGKAKSYYTFITHLKWMPIILIGYISGVIAHLLLNYRLF